MPVTAAGYTFTLHTNARCQRAYVDVLATVKEEIVSIVFFFFQIICRYYTTQSVLSTKIAVTFGYLHSQTP